MAEGTEAPKVQDTAGSPPVKGGAASPPAAPGTPPAGAKPPGGAGAAGSATPAPTFPPEAKTVGLAWLREVTTTALAVAIVGLTLVLIWRTYGAATDFAQKKDVMLYVLTILGTVVGYYFGRVPAERRAEASEETAKQAQGTASDATTAAAQAQQQATQSTQEKEAAAKKLAEAKAGVEKAKAALAAGAGAQRKTLSAGLSESAAPADRSQDALLELEVLSRLL